MHNLNVRIFGPSSFVSTLNELKAYLKFNPLFDDLNNNTNIILFHIDILQDKKQENFIKKNDLIKIWVGKKKDLTDNYDASLELPATLKEINAVVKNTQAKKKFNINF